MIKATFTAPNERITSFTMSGHANFAKKGSDIVCAGASAVSFGMLNAIMSLTDVKPEIKLGDSGYLSCVIPENLSEESEEKVQLLLNSLLISLQTLERDYGKYITVHLSK